MMILKNTVDRLYSHLRLLNSDSVISGIHFFVPIIFICFLFKLSWISLSFSPAFKTFSSSSFIRIVSSLIAWPMWIGSDTPYIRSWCWSGTVGWIWTPWRLWRATTIRMTGWRSWWADRPIRSSRCLWRSTDIRSSVSVWRVSQGRGVWWCSRRRIWSCSGRSDSSRIRASKSLGRFNIVWFQVCSWWIVKCRNVCDTPFVCWI